MRELLIYFFNLKKSAAETHRLLVEAYGDVALSERSCREWFQKFKNDEFDVEANLIESGAHLTNEGLAEIRRIKDGINTGRKD